MLEEIQKSMVETSNRETMELCKRLGLMQNIPAPAYPEMLEMIALRLLCFAHSAIKEHVSPEAAKSYIVSFATELSLHTGLTIRISDPEENQ